MTYTLFEQKNSECCDVHNVINNIVNRETDILNKITDKLNNTNANISEDATSDVQLGFFYVALFDETVS